MINIESNYFNYFNFCECIWCRQTDWPALHKLNGVDYWFEIPKNASSSIKHESEVRHHIRRNTDEYDQLNENEIFPLVVFSDPIQRFITLINDYFVEKNFHYPYGQQICNNLQDLSIEEVVDFVFSNMKLITSEQQSHHFYPQTFFIDTEKFHKFEIIFKENRQELIDRFDLNNKIWWNPTKNKIIGLEHFNEEQVNLIKTIYEEDYQFIEKYNDEKVKS